jgi:YjbE family integral membrane protein
LELEYATKLFSIIVIDLVLSGDNAVVIGMAARSLPPASRKRAILLGGFGAIGLRVLFTILASFLLDIPLLQAAGGVLLIWIAFKLVRPVDHSIHVPESTSLTTAVKTIILADAVMSLDNILAVGGAAHGDQELLIFGLALSIPLLLLGSAVVARIMNRLPLLVFVGVVILVFTAVRMFFEDKYIKEIYHAPWTVMIPVAVAISAVVVYSGVKAGKNIRLPEIAAIEAAERESETTNSSDKSSLNYPA